MGPHHKTKEGTRGACVGTKPLHCLLLCSTLVCSCFPKAETGSTQMRGEASVKSVLQQTIPFQSQAWEKRGFLFQGCDWDTSGLAPLRSISFGSQALPLQRELLAAWAALSCFEFMVLSLVLYPNHLNKGKARALQSWQLTAYALAGHVNSIRRVAAGPRKAVCSDFWVFWTLQSWFFFSFSFWRACRGEIEEKTSDQFYRICRNWPRHCLDYKWVSWVHKGVFVVDSLISLISQYMPNGFLRRKAACLDKASRARAVQLKGCAEGLLFSSRPNWSILAGAVALARGSQRSAWI